MDRKYRRKEEKRSDTKVLFELYEYPRDLIIVWWPRDNSVSDEPQLAYVIISSSFRRNPHKISVNTGCVYPYMFLPHSFQIESKKCQDDGFKKMSPVKEIIFYVTFFEGNT